MRFCSNDNGDFRGDGKMHLWSITCKCADFCDLDTPWRELVFELIIRAKTNYAARYIGHTFAYNKICEKHRYMKYHVPEQCKFFHAWMFLDFVTCVEISSDGDVGVIISSVV